MDISHMYICTFTSKSCFIVHDSFNCANIHVTSSRDLKSAKILMVLLMFVLCNSTTVYKQQVGWMLAFEDPWSNNIHNPLINIQDIVSDWSTLSSWIMVSVSMHLQWAGSTRVPTEILVDGSFYLLVCVYSCEYVNGAGSHRLTVYAMLDIYFNPLLELLVTIILFL